MAAMKRWRKNPDMQKTKHDKYAENTKKQKQKRSKEMLNLYWINVKKVNSLKQCLTATRPTSHK